MSSRNPEECCPRFVPDPWDETTLKWEDRRFVKDRVTSLFHIPLNFGGVMKRNAAKIEAVDADPETMVVLSDENSLWGADVYIEVSKDVPHPRARVWRSCTSTTRRVRSVPRSTARTTWCCWRRYSREQPRIDKHRSNERKYP